MFRLRLLLFSSILPTHLPLPLVSLPLVSLPLASLPIVSLSLASLPLVSLLLFSLNQFFIALFFIAQLPWLIKLQAQPVLWLLGLGEHSFLLRNLFLLCKTNQID